MSLSEHDILSSIQQEINHVLDANQGFIEKLISLKHSIKTHNNTFFNDHPSVLDSVEHLIALFTRSCDKTRFEQDSVKEVEEFICEHEWIHDSIDINIEYSQDIIYCRKCKISANF